MPGGTLLLYVGIQESARVTSIQVFVKLVRIGIFLWVSLFVRILWPTIDIAAAAELTNIGTLFAFVPVAAGVWIVRVKKPDNPRKFKTPS